MQSDSKILSILNKTVDQLSAPQSYGEVCHEHRLGEPLPSTEKLAKIVNMIREILFPGYFGNTSLRPNTIKHYMGVYVDELFEALSEQILAGLCFTCENPEEVDMQERNQHAQALASEFISSLPEIRRKLVGDVETAFVGDPAAKKPKRSDFLLSGYPSHFKLPGGTPIAETERAFNSADNWGNGAFGNRN
jgi:serine O-acetyltransferase